MSEDTVICVGSFLFYKRGVSPLDNNEKTGKFNQVVKAHLSDVYRICLFLVQDKYLAEKIARRAFLTLYQEFENVKPQQYLAQLVHYAKGYASEYQNSLGHKGGSHGQKN